MFHVRCSSPVSYQYFFFFFNDTATTEIYTLSLHDALPICPWFTQRADQPLAGKTLGAVRFFGDPATAYQFRLTEIGRARLNSSHSQISYAVFCLKKKNKNTERCTINSNSSSYSITPIYCTS